MRASYWAQDLVRAYLVLTSDEELPETIVALSERFPKSVASCVHDGGVQFTDLSATYFLPISRLDKRPWHASWPFLTRTIARLR